MKTLVLIALTLGAFNFSYAGNKTAHADRGPAVAKNKKVLAVKVKKAYEDNGDDSFQGTAITKKEMSGDALKFFDHNQRTYGSDYPPSAVQVHFAAHADIIYVIENTDGGSFFGFFNVKDGSTIATGSQGESGDVTWDN